VLAFASLFVLSVESLDVLSPLVVSSDEEDEELEESDDPADLDELSLLESFEYHPDPLKIIPAGTKTFLIRS